MSQTIWKFPFTVDDEVAIIDMPHDARVIHIDTQIGIPMMWAIVNPKGHLHKYTFRLFGTGQPLPDLGHYGTHNYVASFQMEGDMSVWHVFRDAKPSVD